MSAAVPEDPLSSLAPLLRVRLVLDDLCRFGGVWGSPHEAEGPGCAHFQIGRTLGSAGGKPHRNFETRSSRLQGGG
jgi:AraC family transcriptional activator of mtrCDE